MDTAPWWGSGLFTLGGGLLATTATVTLGILNRRTERRRLARTEKIAAYPELLGAATRLAELAVWPDTADPRDRVAEIERLVDRIAFFAPSSVSTTLGPVLASAHELAGLVTRIRADSSPGHGDRIDRRLAPHHRDAVDRLREAVAAFTNAARADLEIRTPYTPIDTQGDAAGTISERAGSREPGAGSREPGAGSRELGRALGLCHAA
ncbi:hypothetical protein [Actinophytocola oryzae]|uniref:Uncharacterized protein n=1 Tax=Actinophytocola oryzae TaxID=502181 RepID=A0A4R7V885_9PSEU|nr:hypothetical protein [Actinophytocola oryzae]TDV44276.1 hypothetical protein CLV71_114186 [Actinophytocola oryzae]